MKDGRIRFLQDYRIHKRGDVINPGYGPAEVYVSRGIAEWYAGEDESKPKRGRPKTKA